MNHKKALGAVFLSSALVLAACGNDKDEPTNENSATDGTPAVEQPAPEQPTTPETTTDGEIAMEAGPYMEVDIEIDIDGKDAYDLEYDEKDRSDNEFKDHLNQSKVEGDAAYETVRSYVDQLTLDANSTKEEAIEQVKKIFNVEDFTKIEVSYKLADGSKVEFEEKR